MADYLVTDTELTSIADAIRTKKGLSSSTTMAFPDGFVSKINNMQISFDQRTVIKTVNGDLQVQKGCLLWQTFVQDDFFAYVSGSPSPIIIDRIYAPDIAPTVLMRPYVANNIPKVALYFYMASGAVANIPSGTAVYFTYRDLSIA